jgi:membrane protein DedA with SNARE-associated domain
VVAPPLASLTSFVGDHGVYAVFALMAAAAIVPAASELVMLVAGAIVAGAVGSAHVVLFGNRIQTAAWGFVAMAVTGVLGNTAGAGLGWLIGAFGGRPFLERYGRYIHVNAARLDLAEQRVARYGAPIVAVGFALPIARSFVAIPAGIFRIPLARFLPLAVVGCAAFCFGLAGAGWALGSSYVRFHHDFRYAEIAIAAAIVALLAYLILRRRSTTLARRAADPPR